MIWRTALAFASRGRLPILIFHRVVEKSDPLLPGEPSAHEFDALLGHIASRFKVLPLAEAARRLYAGTLAPRTLAITFDDGYANNLKVAAPILRKHGMPATVFIATGYLDGGCMWNDAIIESFRSTTRSTVDLVDLGLGVHTAGDDRDRWVAIATLLREVKTRAPEERNHLTRAILERAGVKVPHDLMLTRASVRALAQFGVDVGAHTVNHPILSRVAADTARAEIRQSKQDLENIVGASVTLFAYPNGKPGQDYAGEHVAMVRDAGFDFAVSTSAGAATRRSDPLQLPRFTPWTRQPFKFDLMMLRTLQHAGRDRGSSSGLAA